MEEISSTSNGSYSVENPGYEPGNGYYTDINGSDYVGNWNAEPEFFDKETMNVPKNGRMIAQACEKIVQRILNTPTHSNVYITGSGLDRQNLNILIKTPNYKLDALSDEDRKKYVV